MVVVVKTMLLFWGEKLHTSFYLSLWKPTGARPNTWKKVALQWHLVNCWNDKNTQSKKKKEPQNCNRRGCLFATYGTDGARGEAGPGTAMQGEPAALCACPGAAGLGLAPLP